MDEPRRAELIKRYEDKEKKYEEGRKLWSKDAIRAGMVEPFAFRLSRALKQAGFAQLTVYAYNFAVSKYFKGGTIHVQAAESREATDSDIVQF